MLSDMAQKNCSQQTIFLGPKINFREGMRQLLGRLVRKKFVFFDA
jgi:hypothetical protein